MEQKNTAIYGQRILALVQLWRTGNIGISDYRELNDWYQSLEDKEIGPPVELTVDIVEKGLHEQLHIDTGSNKSIDAYIPPNPWRD